MLTVVSAVQTMYSVENIIPVSALKLCFLKVATFLDGNSIVACWRHNRLPELKIRITTGGSAYIASIYGITALTFY